MHRRTVRPFGESMSNLRLISALMAMLVLWMLFHRLKDPDLWKVLVPDSNPAVAQSDTVQRSLENVPDVIVSHHDDRDPDEWAEIQGMFEFVTDRSPLKSREMDAYWRLMDWSRGQAFNDLQGRAAGDVPFTQLWEQPDRYRGTPIRLKLHVRRVIEYDAPENPSGIAKVCEAWGWTDESRSFPYVVVFTDPPPGLPIGTDVRADLEFAGYFLKTMTYTAFDHARAAPLLVGRIQFAPPRSEPRMDDSFSSTAVIIGLGAVIVLIGLYFRSSFGRRNLKQRTALPDQWIDVSSIPPEETEI